MTNHIEPQQNETNPFNSTQNTTTDPMVARTAALQQYESNRKKGIVAWLLWLFLGVLGAHRFYLGNTGYAIAMLLLGWATFGLWPLIDGLFINGRIREVNTTVWNLTSGQFGVDKHPAPASTQ